MVDHYQCATSISFLIFRIFLTLNTQAASSSKTLYQSTWCHIPDDYNLNSHHCKNCQSHTYKFCVTSVHSNIEKVRLWRQITCIKICATENRNGLLNSTINLPFHIVSPDTLTNVRQIRCHTLFLQLLTRYWNNSHASQLFAQTLYKHKNINAVYTKCTPALKNLDACIGTCPFWTKLRSILCC
jgi:hypothetical protein